MDLVYTAELVVTFESLMDVVVLSETKNKTKKKKGNGNEMRGNYIHFSSGVDKSKKAKAGVSIAVHKKLKNKIK